MPMDGWDGLRGHAGQRERFRFAIAGGRLASSFLFVGPEGIGKRHFARLLAQSLLCETHPEADLDTCGSCPACQQVAAQTHPDLITIRKPSDRSNIPVDLLIGRSEHRMREGMCYDISLRPSRGKRKIAIIDDADFLFDEGANCLLKTLEEPPPGSLIVLIGTSAQKQLPTIRSRCQTVAFHPLARDHVAALLLASGITADAEAAEQAARYGDGSLAAARDWFDVELQELRRTLLKHLADPNLKARPLIGELLPQIEAAGKDAPPRRARMRFACDAAGAFFRSRIRSSQGIEDPNDEGLKAAVAGASTWCAAAAMDGLDRTLDARQHVDRNAHPATWIDAWIGDLDRIHRGERLPLSLLAE